MARQITPFSFTAAFTAKFSHHLSYTFPSYKLLNSASRLHSNECVNQWQCEAAEIMILSTSRQLYRSESINHRAASTGNDSITAPVKLTVVSQKNSSPFKVLNAALNYKGLRSDWSFDFQSVRDKGMK